MNITSISSFGKGKYELHTGMSDTPRIQDYIDRYEKRYLIDLFGKALYDEFEADLILGAGTPTEARFLELFEPLAIDYCGRVYNSEGMAEMLKGFIYYEYVKDMTNQMTSIGNVLPKGENSNRATDIAMLYTRYNEAVKSYRTMVLHICQNLSNYSGYSGNPKGTAYWI